MGTTAGKVVKNTGIIIIGNVISNLIGLLTNIAFVRYLGAKDFGIYSFIFAYLTFFNIIVDFGVTSILIREISRDTSKANKLLGNAIVIRLILSCVAIALACSIISFLNYPFSTKVLVYIASLYFLFSCGSLYSLIFQVNLFMEYPLAIGVLSGLVRLAAFLYVIHLKAGLLWFVVTEVSMNLVNLGLSWRLSRRFVRPKLEFDLSLWRTLFKESWPLALSAVFIVIYSRIDQVMLFAMRGAEDAGYYALAVKLAEVFNIIPAAFMTSVFPFFSRYFVTSKHSLEEAYRLSAKLMMAIIMPVAVGVTLLSQKIIVMFYGEKFLPSCPALAILIWSEIFVFAGLVNNRLLISINQQKIDFAYTGIAAIINVALNFLLIPRYGFIGASIATVVAYAAGPIMNCILKRIRLFGLLMFAQMIKPFCASIIMALCLYYMRSISLAFSIPLSAIIYIALMVLIKGLRREELRLITTR